MNINQQHHIMPSSNDNAESGNHGHRYIYKLNEHDVLCGRGSGPNDRKGNINFRNLVLSRKAEYLAGTSREAKGLVAVEIVATIRSRGGRFVHKLNATQLKERGFDANNQEVYELADEATVLEKTKQTLRQNRADFVKVNGGVVKMARQTMRSGGGEPSIPPSGVVTSNLWGLGGAAGDVASQLPNNLQHLPSMTLNNLQHIPSRLNNLPQAFKHGATSARNLIGQPNNNAPPSNGSLNPIPMGDSGGLDSEQCPKLSANTAQILSEALFASSANNTPSLTNNNSQTLSNGSQMIDPRSNSDSAIDYSALSMNTAELAAAMGMSETSSGMSTTSAEAFSSLVKEYTMTEEQKLMQQFLEQQQHMGGEQQQQQQVVWPQINVNQGLNGHDYQNAVNHQQQQQQQQALLPDNIQGHNNNDIHPVAAKIEQHLPSIPDIQQSSKQFQSVQNNNAQFELESQVKLNNVFEDLVRTYAEGENNQQDATASHPRQQPLAQGTVSNTNITLTPDEQALMYQFQQLQAKMEIQHKEEEVPLNDIDDDILTSAWYGYQPKKKVDSRPNVTMEDSKKALNDTSKDVMWEYTFDPTRRRRSSRRRSTLGNSQESSGTSRMSGTSLRLSQLEPTTAIDCESLTLSYRTAQRLAMTFGKGADSATMADSAQSKKTNVDFDRSMTSLMSLSLDGGSNRDLWASSRMDNTELLKSLEEEPTPTRNEKKAGSCPEVGESFGASEMSLNILE